MPAWTVRLHGMPPVSSIASSAHRTVAVADDRLYVSADGKQWKSCGQSAHAVAFGNGRFVAVGASVLTSADGVAWTQRDAGLNSFDTDHGPHEGAYSHNDLIAVAFSNHRFVATVRTETHDVPLPGEGEPSTHVSVSAISSPDGVTWTAPSPAAAPAQPAASSGSGWPLRSVAFGENRFVAVGAGILTSPDGVAWTPHPCGAPVRGVAYGNGTFLAVGDALWSSSDGATWHRIDAGAANFTAVAFGRGQFLILDQNGAAWNYDGNALRAMGGSDLNAIAFGNDHFLVAGETGEVVTNGHTFDQESVPEPLRAVAYGLERFWALGESGRVYASRDGHEWKPLGRVDATSLGTDGQEIIAVGPHGLATSRDGLTWKRVPGIDTPLYSIASGNGHAVAVGETEILSSP